MRDHFIARADVYSHPRSAFPIGYCTLIRKPLTRGKASVILRLFSTKHLNLRCPSASIGTEIFRVSEANLKRLEMKEIKSVPRNRLFSLAHVYAKCPRMDDDFLAREFEEKI
jgi:hypothetical protein